MQSGGLVTLPQCQGHGSPGRTGDVPDGGRIETGLLDTPGDSGVGRLAAKVVMGTIGKTKMGLYVRNAAAAAAK